MKPSFLRVLVADDMTVSRELLCNMVRTLGHEVISVAGGVAAVEQVTQQAPDLLLLDLLMPDMDGFEVIGHVRNLVTQRWLPVIVISSLEGDEHFIEALRRGADDYLSRPINPALLEAKLRHYARVLGLQSELALLAQRQRDIHDNILDAVITLDNQHLIQGANRAAIQLFGHGANTLDGCQVEAVLGTPASTLLVDGTHTLNKAQGSPFPAEVAVSGWRDSAGQQRYTLVIRDLTERQRVDRMKDEFLATVSHELRTPLTSILGALGLLASGAAGTLPKAALPLAEVAKRNGERLSHLIDDILDLTKLEGNKMVLHLRSCSLDTLINEALAANEAYAERAGVSLQSDLVPVTHQARLDPERFLQIMANLLSNAIKHSAAGDVVTIKLLLKGEQLQVLVQDRGPGIDPQFRQKMFEKFSQADSSDRRSQGGTGLGLYITRILVERMGGRIWVDSTPGQGASFGIEFPSLNDSTSILDAPQTGAWLLHVDSDVDARARVAQWLQASCTVVGVGDMQQAHNAMPRSGTPIVLADPQAQGAAEPFCAALKNAAQGQRVLLYSDAVDDAFASRMGMTWLRKSATSRSTLVAAVRSALETSLTEKQL